MRLFAPWILVCLAPVGLSCQATDEPRTQNRLDEAGGDGETGGGPGETDTLTENQGSDTTAGSEGCGGIDLLFVVDNTESMTSVKRNLIENFPKFVGVLDAYNASKGGDLEFRVAVTSASVDREFVTTVPNSDLVNPYSTSGDNGAFLGAGECGLDENWIEGPGPDFTEQFTCLADVQTDQASNIEMPFAAIEAALGPQSAPGKPNAGFYTKHQDHLLVVVIITNEEDCSIDDGGTLMFTGTGSCDDEESEGLYAPERVKGILDDATGREGRYVMVAIAGPGPGKCSSAFGEAWDAIRIRKTIDALGEYGVFGSLCESDLWISLETALSTIKTSCDYLPPVV